MDSGMKMYGLKASIQAGSAFLEQDGITYLLAEKPAHIHHQHKKKMFDEEEHTQMKMYKCHAYNFKWIDANKNLHVVKQNKESSYNNYFIGADKSKWKSNVGNYKTIKYENLYQNIDAKVYSENTSMKIDYIIHKNGKVEDIKIKYNGVDNISINDKGQLLIKTSISDVIELKPYAYQKINGFEMPISCIYEIKDNVLNFKILDQYDKNFDLIIDPTLIFSTYSGSPSDNWGSSSTNDADGNMFLGGISLDVGYPTTLGAFQTNFGGGTNPYVLNSDIVITKFNSTGNSRIYSTYLGGRKNELLKSLYCTPENELVVFLTTGSPNFPTTSNAYDTTFNGGSYRYALSFEFDSGVDVAIVKLNNNGTALVGSSYYGGNGIDGLALSYNYGDATRGDIAVTKNGDIIICSISNSTDLPNTAGRFQPNLGGNADGFIARFNNNLTNLYWSSYYGSINYEIANSITLDKAENIFICGVTNSPDLPARDNGLYPNFNGYFDGYLAKINSNATQVLASTYLGTETYDQAFILDADADGNIVVFGQSTGDYPVSAGVYSNTKAPQFIHKLNNNINTSIFSTVFGNTVDEDNREVNIVPTALLVDICGSIYAVGWGGYVNNEGTTENMPITSDAYQSTTDGSDFYLINFNRDATQIIYATYFGENGGEGDHVDGGTSRFDKNGIVYEAVCASCLGTNNFPTTVDAYSRNNNSDNCNMAGFKFKFDLLAMQIINITPVSSCSSDSVRFSYTSTQPATSFLWHFGDGQSSTTEFPVHKYATKGNYIVTLIIRNPDNCNVVDSASITISIGENVVTNKDTAICTGSSFVFNGQTIIQAGTYRDTLKTTTGCDSFIVFNVSLSQAIVFNKDTAICSGSSFVFNGQTITQAGTYRDTLKTTTGCDSFIVFNVSLNQANIIKIDTTICDGNSIQIAGKNYNTAGTFFDTLKTINLCDSILEIKINIIEKQIENIQKEICIGTSISIGNQIFDKSGKYEIILQSSITKCDSIINLDLHIKDTLLFAIDTTICDGDSVVIENESFKIKNTYKIYLKSFAGCDSLIILNLNVSDKKYTTIYDTICEAEFVKVGDSIINKQGTYIITLNSAEQCDSTVTINLTVHSIKYTNIDTTLCEGYSILVGNTLYNKTGTYADTLLSSLNCDSIINLNLTMLSNAVVNLYPEICEGEQYTIADSVFTKTGEYMLIYKAANSCDSIINIYLTVNLNKTTNLQNEICNGDSVIVGNNVYKIEGQYTTLLKSSKNCDSTVILDLIVHQHKTTNVDTSICFGDSILVGTHFYKTNGQFVENLYTTKSCDSIVTLNLNIYDEIKINAIVDKSLIEKGENVQLDVETNQELIYLWSPKNTIDDAAIKNPIASPITPTWFVVEATNASTNCTTKDSVFVNILILPCNNDYVFIPNAFTPNGDNVNDVFRVRSKNLISGSLMVFDRWGNKMFESDDINVGWDGTYKGKMQQQEVYGFYFVGTCDGGENITIKGNVTLFK
jgi:gliding motility-associated-like protein